MKLHRANKEEQKIIKIAGILSLVLLIILFILSFHNPTNEKEDDIQTTIILNKTELKEIELNTKLLAIGCENTTIQDYNQKNNTWNECELKLNTSCDNNIDECSKLVYLYYLVNNKQGFDKAIEKLCREVDVNYYNRFCLYSQKKIFSMEKYPLPTHLDYSEKQLYTSMVNDSLFCLYFEKDAKEARDINDIYSAEASERIYLEYNCDKVVLLPCETMERLIERRGKFEYNEEYINTDNYLSKGEYANFWDLYVKSDCDVELLDIPLVHKECLQLENALHELKEKQVPRTYYINLELRYNIDCV